MQAIIFILICSACTAAGFIVGFRMGHNVACQEIMDTYEKEVKHARH